MGSRPRPPTVVAVKSPMAWMELTAKSRPMDTQEARSKVMPKGRTSGAAAHPEEATPLKSTMPKHRATA